MAWQIRRIWHTANLIPTQHNLTNASPLSIVIAACGRNIGDRLLILAPTVPCSVRPHREPSLDAGTLQMPCGN